MRVLIVYINCYGIHCRTPSWNYVNNSEKQWLVREMKPLDPKAMSFTDLLQRKRLQTLQSVDSLVEKVSVHLSQFKPHYYS